MPAADDFSQCQSQLDIGKKLLVQVGVPEDAMTNSMIEQAAAANEAFVDRLETIAGGH